MRAAPANTEVRSVDLLKELRSEQASFRWLMRLLAVFLSVAAVIVVASVAYFWLRLDSNAKNLTADFEALQAVNTGISDQKRETINDEGVRLRESLQFAAADDESIRIARDILNRASAESHVDDAVRLAKGHFAGDLLNNSSVQVLRSVLEYDSETVPGTAAFVAALDAPDGNISLETGEPEQQVAATGFLQPTERLLMEAAIGVSGAAQLESLQSQLRKLTPRGDASPASGTELNLPKEKIDLLEKLEQLADHDDDAIEALGYAGLAMFYYQEANADNLRWSGLCENVDEYTLSARKKNFEPPHLMLYRAECLRKYGEAEESHAQFQAALEAMSEEVGPGEFDPWVVPAYRQMLHHGLGTTQLAMIAENGDGGKISSVMHEQIGEAERQLDLASRIRDIRGATDMGIAYTKENIGFIYLYRGVWYIGTDSNPHWKQALDHTKSIDATLAWNLAVRYIAAKELEKALHEDPDAKSGEIEDARSAKDVARRAFMHWPCDSMDMRELLKLMPNEFDDDIRRLRPECEAA